MPLPLPPDKGGLILPNQVSKQASRLGTVEGINIPKPRTYYANTGLTLVSATTTKTLIVRVPIFYKPGDLVMVSCGGGFFYTTAAASVQVYMEGGPFPQTIIPIIKSIALPAFPSSVVLQSSVPDAPNVDAGVQMTAFTPYAASMIALTNYAGSAPVTTAGMINLDFKLVRSAGTGTVNSLGFVVNVLVV